MMAAERATRRSWRFSTMMRIRHRHGWPRRPAHFADDGVIAVGGPGVTPPARSAARSKQAEPCTCRRSCPRGYMYRYLPDRPRDVDDYPSCNLLVRREPFLRARSAVPAVLARRRHQTCLLLTKSGASESFTSPAAVVFHHRRSLFWGHFRQVWNYAVHRGFFAKRYPETSLRPAYFVPSAFLVANAALLLALASPPGAGNRGAGRRRVLRRSALERAAKPPFARSERLVVSSAFI